jgi:hypothetical protein
VSAVFVVSTCACVVSSRAMRKRVSGRAPKKTRSHAVALFNSSSTPEDNLGRWKMSILPVQGFLNESK